MRQLLLSLQIIGTFKVGNYQTEINNSINQ
jgi:hypothetical protein